MRKCPHYPSLSFQNSTIEIDCENFARFLQEEIPPALINQLRANPTVQFHRKAIDQIAVGLDIWDKSNTTNKDSHLLCIQALRSSAAHASAQHNIEQLVKLGALMSSKGKSEIMASIFASASNDFMTEHHDGDAYLEVPANQPAMAADEPKWRKRGNYRGRKKLLDLESEAKKKSNQLAAIATKLGAQAYNARIKAIGTCLRSKADNLLERSSNTKVGTMMATFDKPDKQANVRQRKPG